MDKISIGAVWEEAGLFFRREFALLAPVAAIGFGLPMVILLMAVPVDQAQSGRLAAGPWMLWFLPCGALSLIGSVAISALALRPGISVKECLGVAFSRVPTALGLIALYVGVQVALVVPIVVLARIDLAVRGGAGPFTLIGQVAEFAFMIWLFVRLMPLWALVAERPVGPWEAVRTVFAATRGRYRLLLLVRVVAVAAGVIALGVTLVPLGALAAVIGMATGNNDVSVVLSYLATATVFAVLVSLWTVFVAQLYRRLAASSGI